MQFDSVNLMRVNVSECGGGPCSDLLQPHQMALSTVPVATVGSLNDDGWYHLDPQTTGLLFSPLHA